MASLPALPQSYEQFSEEWVAGPNLGDHSWMNGGSRISLPLLDHPAHVPEVYPFGYNRIHFGPSSSYSNPLQNLEIKNENDETIAAQCIAEANPQRVHAAQKYDDVPPIEANLGPLEAEFKLTPNEGEIKQPADRGKVLLNGASPNVSVNQSCEGAKDSEAEHSRKGNSDDMSNEFSTVGTEDNVPGVSNDLLQKEDVALRLFGHEKDQRLRIKDDAIKVENMFSALMEDSEVEEEQEETKREEETGRKQTEHGNARREKKKKPTRRTSPASEGSGPDSQWSSIGVLSLPLVCFLILSTVICIY